MHGEKGNKAQDEKEKLKKQSEKEKLSEVNLYLWLSLFF